MKETKVYLQSFNAVLTPQSGVMNFRHELSGEWMMKNDVVTTLEPITLVSRCAEIKLYDKIPPKSRSLTDQAIQT
jgi:hypothetical protein